MALAHVARSRSPWLLPQRLAAPLGLTRQTQPFSTTPLLQKKKNPNQKTDRRITLIRYFLSHPALPRPLRFSRSRFLRHWTIHRAWQLFRRKQQTAQQVQLEKQYQSMRDACEALRLIGEDGLAVADSGKAVPPPGARDIPAVTVKVDGKDVGLDVSAAAQRQKEVGRLYRIAMEKRGVWQGVPIEYARSQTDTPSRLGWDHAWTR